MARKFSFPEVQTLAVGESTYITGDRAGIARKIKLYAARANRAYGMTANGAVVQVIRLPDPVPEAA